MFRLRVLLHNALYSRDKRETRNSKKSTAKWRVELHRKREVSKARTPLTETVIHITHRLQSSFGNGKFRGLRPDSLNGPTRAGPLITVLYSIYISSTDHVDSSSNQYLPRRIAYSWVLFLRAWANHASAQLIYLDSMPSTLSNGHLF